MQNDRGPWRTGTLVVLSILVAVVLIGIGLFWWASSNAPTAGWGMMGSGWGGGWGWMWAAGLVMMVVPFVLLVALLLLLFRPVAITAGAAGPLGAVSPENEVRMRYARGEISAEQYRLLLEGLKGN